MAILTLSNILDDLRVAEETLHKFERRYWLSSSAFYDLYSKGLLDDGSHAEDFSEWAGHYKLKLKREVALEMRTYVRYALQGIMGYHPTGGRTDVNSYYRRAAGTQDAGSCVSQCAGTGIPLFAPRGW